MHPGDCGPASPTLFPANRSGQTADFEAEHEPAKMRVRKGIHLRTEAAASQDLGWNSNRTLSASLDRRTEAGPEFHGRSSPFETQTAYALMPGGAGGSAGTLGGSGLAVSQHSPHIPEAIRLVQFLIRAQIQSNRAEDRAFVDTPQVPVDESGKSNPKASGVVNRHRASLATSTRQSAGLISPPCMPC
jgi:hypothetical protein